MEIYTYIHVIETAPTQLAMVPSRLFPAPPVLGYNSTRMVTSVHSASGDTGDAGEGKQSTRKAHWSHMLSQSCSPCAFY